MLRYARTNRALLLLVAVLVGQWLLGCTNLCTKRLYLYRDAPEKRQAPANMTLLITDPNLARAVMAGRLSSLDAGCPWAEEKPAYEADAYRLSIDGFDGKPVYQGLCMDTTPTYACEVRPGSRQARLRLDLFGPWGHESKKEMINLTLEAGKSYFLRPDSEALQNKIFVLKVDSLPDAYTPELRARVGDWERRHSKGRDLAD
ncbi:MAG: hypothetical protein HY790_07235 [Deltaproteobacteria bacterium]|nr:hypothetical protein [Deltaproteobacteria bacterium]